MGVETKLIKQILIIPFPLYFPRYDLNLGAFSVFANFVTSIEVIVPLGSCFPLSSITSTEIYTHLPAGRWSKNPDTPSSPAW